MRPQINETSKGAKIVLGVGIFLIVAGAVTYLLWDSSPAPAPRPNITAARPEPLPAPPTGAAGISAPVTISQGDYLNSPTDLRQLTELQAELEVEKLNVAIAEQKARKAELQGTTGASALPQIVAMPTEAGAFSPEGERVISIQGIGGHVIATVATAGGTQSVKVGDAFGDGRVERISINGLEIREGGGTRLISVEE